MQREDRGILLTASLAMASLILASMSLLIGVIVAIHPPVSEYLTPAHNAELAATTRWNWVFAAGVLAFDVLSMRGILLRRPVWGDRTHQASTESQFGLSLLLFVVGAIAVVFSLSSIHHAVGALAASKSSVIDNMSFGGIGMSLFGMAMVVGLLGAILHQHQMTGRRAPTVGVTT